MIWGALSDRFGASPVVFSGAILVSISLWLSAQAPNLLAFQLRFGVLLGGSISAFFAPFIATVMGWFITQRSLAVSLVSAGMGMAPVTMSPLAAKLSENHDWRMVLTLLSFLVAMITIPTSLVLRRPPHQADQSNQVSANLDMPDAAMPLRRAVTSPQFLVLTFTNFFCCATHSGPIFHTVSYAELCGNGAMAAVSIYSVDGLAGMFGRFGFGVAGDRFGAKRVLVAGLLAQSIGAPSYYLARDLGQFYLVAPLFGFIYSGIMPLYAILVRENFPMSMLGTILGATGMAGGLGMAFRPVLGGWIFDPTGGYGRLYIAGFGLGLAGFLTAITFRPFPRSGHQVPLPAL